MEYHVLTVGISDALSAVLQGIFTTYHMHLIISPTVQAANSLLKQHLFHMLIADLDYLQNSHQVQWLKTIRYISFLPIIVISDSPETEIRKVLHLGADICVSGEKPYTMLEHLVLAQIRRYTQYNRCLNPADSAFNVGDIFIDSAHRVVEVCGESVELRPREFSLLLYFMKNPNIVLTSEQICEHAWGLTGSYNRGVAQPIRLLRLAIEPDPKNPVYIKTVRQVGYRFNAYNVETCDKC